MHNAFTHYADSKDLITFPLLSRVMLTSCIIRNLICSIFVTTKNVHYYLRNKTISSNTIPT